MNIIQSFLLGIVQGLTEFIPVSSTAHLILVPWLLGWDTKPDFATFKFVFDILVQLGTLAAVIAYFWKDLLNIAGAVLGGLARGKPFEATEARLGWLIVIATIPAVVVGLLFKDFFESLHNSPVIVAAILIATAGLLLVSEQMGRQTRRLDSITWRDAVIIGIAQSFALFPGVSRSAATISGGLIRDLDRPAAARFSFLMSIPALLAAGTVGVKDLVALPHFTTYLPPLAIGFLAAAVVGFVSIRWLLNYLAGHPMNVFAWYRIAAGVLCVIVFFVRG
jgi:undecaprenyl-diphosphatase